MAEPFGHAEQPALQGLLLASAAFRIRLRAAPELDADAEVAGAHRMTDPREARRRRG